VGEYAKGKQSEEEEEREGGKVAPCEGVHKADSGMWVRIQWLGVVAAAPVPSTVSSAATDWLYIDELAVVDQ
jgi:hypothetical protein